MDKEKLRSGLLTVAEGIEALDDRTTKLGQDLLANKEEMNSQIAGLHKEVEDLQVGVDGLKTMALEEKKTHSLGDLTRTLNEVVQFQAQMAKSQSSQFELLLKSNADMAKSQTEMAKSQTEMADQINAKLDSFKRPEEPLMPSRETDKALPYPGGLEIHNVQPIQTKKPVDLEPTTEICLEETKDPPIPIEPPTYEDSNLKATLLNLSNLQEEERNHFLKTCLEDSRLMERVLEMCLDTDSYTALFFLIVLGKKETLLGLCEQMEGKMKANGRMKIDSISQIAEATKNAPALLSLRSLARSPQAAK